MRPWFAAIGLCACGSTPSDVPSDAGVADVHDARACSKQPTGIAQGMPSSTIAVDDSDVYWIDTRVQPYALQRTPKTGGATSQLALDVVAFALDSTSVYYDVQTFDDGGTASTLFALPKADAGAASVVAVGAFAAGIVADTVNLYFASGGIQFVPKTGGTPQPLTTTPASALVGVDDTSVYWMSSATSSVSIWATPKVGGASVEIAQVPGTVQRAVLDGGAIYFTSSETKALSKVSIATRTVTTLASGLGLNGGTNLAARNGLVFVDQQDQGQYPAIILAVPADGGPARDTCAGGSMNISGIAVDDTTLFWGLIYEATGGVLQMPL